MNRLKNQRKIPSAPITHSKERFSMTEMVKQFDLRRERFHRYI